MREIPTSAGSTSDGAAGEIKVVSLAEYVFERMENDILSGKYRRGETFTESKLSELFGVSRTPIREAIRRLEQENLIRITKKGVEITGIDRRDIEDIYEIRERLEGLAAKRCAGVIAEDGIAALRETVDLQEFYAGKGMSEKVRDTDSAFHEAIYAMCGSSVYLSVLSSLHRRIRKYRKLSLQDSARAVRAVAEHREILDALAAHDGERAERLTARHIRNARDNILKNISDAD